MLEVRVRDSKACEMRRPCGNVGEDGNFHSEQRVETIGIEEIVALMQYIDCLDGLVSSVTVVTGEILTLGTYIDGIVVE